MSHFADYFMPRIVISLTVISLLLASSCDAPPPAYGADYAPLVAQATDNPAERIAAANQAAREQEAKMLKVYEQADFDVMRGVVYEPPAKGTRYYFVDGNGRVETDRWDDFIANNERLEFGAVWLNKGDAEQAAAARAKINHGDIGANAKTVSLYDH